MFTIIENENDIEIQKYLVYDNPNVIIPSNINEKPVTRIGHDCFFNHLYGRLIFIYNLVNAMFNNLS